MVDYVESFTGSDVVAMHTMLINKPPDAGELDGCLAVYTMGSVSSLHFWVHQLNVWI